MKLLYSVLICLAVIPAGYAKHPVVASFNQHNDDQDVKDALNSVLTEEYSGDLGFSWSNCGSGSDPIVVHSLAVSPDPIEIPGSLNFSADVTLMQDIVAPSSVALKVYKKLFGVFVEVPCLDNFGSCTYTNPCALLSKVKCPPVLEKYGINCRCPLKKAEYKVPATVLSIPTLPIPSFIENGDYKIQATLMKGSTRLGCYEIKASLKKK
eukprot:gene12659-13959_t